MFHYRKYLGYCQYMIWEIQGSLLSFCIIEKDYIFWKRPSFVITSMSQRNVPQGQILHVGCDWGLNLF